MIEYISKLIRDAVQFAPKDMGCAYPNTYRFLGTDMFTVLSSETLGAISCDMDKPYFYSRSWEAAGYTGNITYDYPLVTAYDIGLRHPKDKPMTNRCYNMEIAALDIYNKEGCKSQNCKSECSGCEGRLEAEVYADTEILINSILVYISECVFVFGYGFVHKSEVANLIFNGMIQRDDRRLPAEKIYSAESLKVDRMRIKTTHDLVGTVAYLDFCFDNCPSFSYDFSKVVRPNPRHCNGCE